LIIAIIDTTELSKVYEYHFFNKKGEASSTYNIAVLPQRKMIKLVYTGNHYLSVEQDFLIVNLEKILEHYELRVPRVQHGVFRGQLPRNLRDICTEFITLKQELSKKTPDILIVKDGLQNIIESSKSMGPRHPILFVARKLEYFLLRYERSISGKGKHISNNVKNMKENLFNIFLGFENYKNGCFGIQLCQLITEYSYEPVVYQFQRLKDQSKPLVMANNSHLAVNPVVRTMPIATAALDTANTNTAVVLPPKLAIGLQTEVDPQRENDLSNTRIEQDWKVTLFDSIKAGRVEDVES